jgi:uridine phosphorylase
MGHTTYHIGLSEPQLECATLALLPGDPGRVEELASSAALHGARELASTREFRTWIAWAGATPIVVTSTGIGGPSTSIAIDELAQIGVRTFVRVGTTGAIQKHVNVGSAVITTGAVRLDGASKHYAPVEYPAVAHYDVLHALVCAACELGIPYHAGITASCDTFYPGQERHESYSHYVRRKFQGATEEWRHLNVLNYEMEAATVLTLCSAMGLRGGCVEGVVVNRTRSEVIDGHALAAGESAAIRIGIRAAVRLADAPA